MPKVYSEEKREEIKEELINEGLELVKQYGLKKMSIEAITKKVGIAQGTFYNFYKSKEVLIYHIAKRYQEKINEKMYNLVQIKGHLDRNDIKNIYYNMILKDEDNIYRYLKREDMEAFLTRLPKEYFSKISDVKEEMEKNLNYVRGKKKEYDLDAIINWIQIMNLTVENKDILIESKIEKIIDKMLENMLDEIFDTNLEE